jgi:GNAT superfamily N-acetyltransferase
LRFSPRPVIVVRTDRSKDHVTGEDEQIVQLKDGSRARVRPIQPDDKDALAAGLDRLSNESRYRRFLRPVTRLSDRELQYLTEVDYTNHFAWVAADPGDDMNGYGVARYVRDPKDPEVAEAAVAVVDDQQGNGLGSILMRLLVATALDNGITTFRGWVLGDNREMLGPLERIGARRTPEQGVLRVEVSIGEMFEGSSVHEILRAAAAGTIDPEPRA